VCVCARASFSSLLTSIRPQAVRLHDALQRHKVPNVQGRLIRWVLIGRVQVDDGGGPAGQGEVVGHALAVGGLDGWRRVRGRGQGKVGLKR